MIFFTDFQEAFSYCREVNHPVIVKVKRKTWKLFPSGHAKPYPWRAGKKGVDNVLKKIHSKR
ncbi:MAG: hypothetical protein IBX72_14515 [Nitrospirae bacterium]|nr:hypothetical protein [Nitrospirota bacterium]